MVKTEREYRDDICQIGRLVFQKGWVAANDGNITIRMDADRILATPTGVCKGMMQPDDLIIVDMKGTKISGRAQGTTEIAMHTTVYGLRPDIKAVVHAHPPVATGFATAGRQLNLALLPEVIIGLGCVPLADYGLPGTDALTEPMLPLIPKFDALLMANHGAVCYGEDVFKAYFKMETMEHFARIQMVAELLGGPKVLPRTEVDKLLDARTRYGVKSRSAGEPNCPMSAEEAEQESQRKQAEYARQTAIVQAQYKAEVDKAQAEAAQAGPLAQASTQRDVIAAQTELAQRQAELRQQQLVAEVVKPAEADAEKTRVIAKADAERMKIQAEAAASYNRVALDRMLIDQLPLIVREAANGLANANINVLNGADGLGQIAAGLVVQGLTIFDSVKQSMSESRESAPPPPEFSAETDDGGARPKTSSLLKSPANADLDRAARGFLTRAR